MFLNRVPVQFKLTLALKKLKNVSNLLHFSNALRQNTDLG